MKLKKDVNKSLAAKGEGVSAPLTYVDERQGEVIKVDWPRTEAPVIRVSMTMDVDEFEEFVRVARSAIREFKRRESIK
jgi:hypothetical protein